MTCKEANLRIHETLDQRTARWPHPLALHLGECARCRAQSEQLAAVTDAIVEHEVPMPSSRYFATAAKRAVLARRRPPVPRFRHFRFAAMTAGAAALCIVSFWLGRALSPEPRASGVPTVSAGPGEIATLPAAGPGLSPMDVASRLPMATPEPIPVGAPESLPLLPALEEVDGGGNQDGMLAPPARELPQAAAPRASSHTSRASATQSSDGDTAGQVVIEGPGHRIVIRRIEGGTEIGPLAPSATPWVTPEPTPSTDVMPAEYRM